MGRQKLIPDDIREKVKAIVDQFNEEHSFSPQNSSISQLFNIFRGASAAQRKPTYPIGTYIPRFRGKFLYLDRIGYGQDQIQICRLTWDGDIDNWGFAIYKHSRNKYDANEWFFPGFQKVNGTVEGAMRAGNEAYPL